jgi:hypothetical protein
LRLNSSWRWRKRGRNRRRKRKSSVRNCSGWRSSVTKSCLRFRYSYRRSRRGNANKRNMNVRSANASNVSKRSVSAKQLKRNKKTTNFARWRVTQQHSPNK